MALGLTGGGSIFAVPLLIDGLAIDPHSAVAMSLAAVPVTAAMDAWRRGSTGRAIFTGASKAFAPARVYIGDHVDRSVVLLLFSALMVLVSARVRAQRLADAMR